MWLRSIHLSIIRLGVKTVEGMKIKKVPRGVVYDGVVVGVGLGCEW